jgi:hypothetical protein
MAIYTVHEPPAKADNVSAEPERFVFVRDGFHFWAFALAPVWLLWRRLWLAFFVYLVVIVALQAGMQLIGASGTTRFLVSTLLSLLIGFEASTLRRFKLRRRGWRDVGIVVADDLELAERRFFDSWTGHEAPQPASTLPTVSRLKLPPPSSDVIGLFPQPGVQR